MSAFQHPDPSQPQPREEAIPPPPPPPSHDVVKPHDQLPSVVAAQQHRPPTPPPSLPSVEQPTQLPPDPSAVPPPPTVPLPLPSEIVQPPQLQHLDSSNTASSVVAEPPTPVATTPAPPPRENGNGNGVASEHAGLGTGAHGEGQPGHSAVDVLADVAMGEAALDLAGFAAGASQAGAGSADVQKAAVVPQPPSTTATALAPGPRAEPSPPLKRSYDESSSQAINEGYFTGVNGGSTHEQSQHVNGFGGDVESRETKRPRVGEEGIPHEESASLPTVSVAPPASSASVPPSFQPAAPAPLSATPQPQPHVQPSASSVTPLDPALSGSGLPPSTMPAVSVSAPPTVPSPAAASTMSPSDLHHFQGAGQPQSNAEAPAPPPQPSPVPAQVPASDPSSNVIPQPQPHLSSTSPYPEAHAQSASPYPAPVASTSSAGIAQSPAPANSQSSPFPPPVPAPAGDSQQEPQPHQPSVTPNPDDPPPAEPIAVMTKEQQKHAINLVRNLKRNKNASPFLKPVDHIALHIPDYYKIITQPMDLGTIEGRLQATGKAMTNVQKVGRIYGLDYSYGTQPGQWEGIVPEGFEPKGYRTVQEFKDDLDRVWNNCFRYNGPRDKNPVSAMAGLMMDAAEKNYRGMPFAPAVSPYPPRHVEQPKVKQEPRPAPGFVPTIRRDDASSRPKREIHAPVKDLAYLDSADASLGGGGVGAQAQYQATHGMMPMAGGSKPRNGRKSGAQEQLRYCKETIKELFKKTHEPYAYPFYHPVDLAAYPTYSQYVSRPMDLGTIRSKLEHNQYPMPPYDAFESDVRQIFENCFAFNPAGTIVHDWGRQLEAVFEIKWADRPMDDDFSDDDGLNVMEQQLQMLAANIEQMRQNKKAQKEAKRFQQAQHARPMPPMPMPMPMAAKPPRKSSTSGTMGGYNPYMPPARAPQPKKSRPSGGGGGGGGQKKKKRRDDDSDDYYEDDGGAYYGGSAHVGHGGGGGGGGGGGNRRHVPVQQEEWVDFDMKRELAVKIVTFEGEQLEEAINIIRRGRPDLLGAANQEVELDIDQLDQRTLVSLYRYVCPGAPVAVRPVENPKPTKQQTSNKAPRNQRKNLDEDKEAERIQAMEAQLKAFEKSPVDASMASAAGGAMLPTPQGGEEGGGGGDQASSDSSDEASSDSDSDED